MELYFDDLARATRFYRETLGLRLRDGDPQRYATFRLAPGFLCLEHKGHEDYPSADKAVVFIEVADLRAALAAVPRRQLVRAAWRAARPWAAVRDPEGHTVLLLQTKRRRRARPQGASVERGAAAQRGIEGSGAAEQLISPTRPARPDTPS